MTTLDAARIDAVRAYFRLVDAKDPALLDLFTDDVELYFPKFGVARGKASMQRLAQRIARDAATLTHDIEGLVFTVQGERIAVEGREHGVTADGRAWPDGVVSQGRFANVFEFAGALIRRIFIYVDPDFVNDDQARIAWYQGEAAPASAREVATAYFARVGAFWAAPHDPRTLAAILALVAEDVDWDIPGDLATVPWIGPRHGHAGVAAFYRELAEQISPERFAVQHILADGDVVVAIGALASRVKATGRLIESPFAFVMTVRHGLIVHYRMLEDSHAVAVAAAGSLA